MWNGNIRSNLQVLVVDFQNISDIEGSLLGTAGLFHELSVDVPSWRHDNNDVLSLLIKEEGNVSYLWAWQEKVEGWTQGINRQVINLQNGRKKDEIREIYCSSTPKLSW